MWTVKKFKTVESFNLWILNQGYKFQWNEIFINNVIKAIECKKLTKIY